MMAGALSDWPLLIQNAFSNLNANGYIELQDVETLTCDDETFRLYPPSCLLAEWWGTMLNIFRMCGKRMDASADHSIWLQEAGFVDINEKILKWPINRWPRDRQMKEIGTWSLANTLDALEAMSIAPYTRILGWSQEAVQALLVEIGRASCRERV